MEKGTGLSSQCLGRLRQEDLKLEAILSHLARYCLSQNHKIQKGWGSIQHIFRKNCLRWMTLGTAKIFIT
ncbi:hypothetical protein V4Y02_23950, partial [Escherichia coli]